LYGFIGGILFWDRWIFNIRTVVVVIIPFGLSWRTPDEHEFWCPFYRKINKANQL